MSVTWDEERIPCAVMVASPLWPLQVAEPDHQAAHDDGCATDEKTHPDGGRPPARPDAG